jgi:hypothetical protein
VWFWRSLLALFSRHGGPASDMRLWTPEEREAIDKFVFENSLEGARDEVEMWIEALMSDGAPFASALSQAELMFAE